MKILEIVAPTTQKQETWYHGTPYEKGAQNIIQKGLAYDDEWVEIKYKGRFQGFEPMKDGVYITRNLGEAFRYTLVKEGGPNGFIFKFPRSDLKSISNDEDELGNYIATNIEQYSELKGKISAELLNGAKERVLKSSAQVGKIALQNLSKDKISELLNIIDGKNLVHYGTLKPVSVIEYKKPSQPELNDWMRQYNSYPNSTSVKDPGKPGENKPLADWVAKYGKEKQLS